MKSTDIKELVAKKVRECYESAIDKYGDRFHFPTWDFAKRGKAAGTANLWRGHISFNYVLLSENVDQFIEEIVPHEVAHIVAWNVYGDKGHGRGWKSVMIECYGMQPARCHNFDITSVQTQRIQTTILYKCGCKEHNISTRMHNNILSGKRYICRSCKNTLWKPINTNNKDLPLAASASNVSSTRPNSKKTNAGIFYRINPHLNKEDYIEYYTDMLELALSTACAYYNYFKRSNG